MKGYMGLAFVLLMTFPIMVLIPDLIVYGTYSYKANTIVEQTTKEAEMQGGITQEVEEQYNKAMKRYGMDGKGFKISYDRTGKFEHRGRFEVELAGQYTFRAFNLLGTGVGQFTLPIVSKDSGVNEVWLR